MGGAVVVRTVPLLLEAKYRVSGVAVLDVVEGTALDALPHMPAILNSRPEGFDSVSDAIEWQYVLCILSRTNPSDAVQYHCAPDPQHHICSSVSTFTRGSHTRSPTAWGACVYLAYAIANYGIVLGRCASICSPSHVILTATRP